VVGVTIARAGGTARRAVVAVAGRGSRGGGRWTTVTGRGAGNGADGARMRKGGKV